ncbi:hypothetical protein OF83DRAFT_1179741 [Amylostereum chailletii]|nr:hypothetical protein OF83DRAFT_1179741 [Amylostereum chailletii]
MSSRWQELQDSRRCPEGGPEEGGSPAVRSLPDNGPTVLISDSPVSAVSRPNHDFKLQASVLMTSVNEDQHTYQRLCKDIFMLTHILNNDQVHESTNNCNTASRDNSTLKAMDNITTLLASGTSRGREISVVGRVNPAARLANAVVFVSQNTSKTPVGVTEVKELKTDTSPRDIFRKGMEGSHDGHFADVFTMLDEFRTLSPDTNTYSDGYIDLSLYVIHRAHRKIALQMLKGERLWEEHPMRVLRRRIPFISVPDEAFPFELKTRSTVAQALFADRGFRPFSSDGGVFIVDQGNIASWLSLCCDAYEKLEECLIADTTTRRPRTSVDGPAVGDAMMNLEVLQALLKSKFMDLVLNDKVLDVRLSDGYIAPGRGRGAGAAPGDLRSAIETEGRDNETEIVAEDMRMTDEEPRHHVVRYLRASLPTPTPSARFLSPVVYLPTLSVEDFKRELRGRFDPGRYNLDSVFDRPGSKLAAEQIRDTVVHAEAGVMGVACAFWNAQTKSSSQDDFSPPLPMHDSDERARDVVHDVFSVHEIHIGVGRLSCWCCWRLRTLLGEYSTRDSARTPYPQFLLDGTHATISPWHPPSYGIPESVLRKMKGELEREVGKLAKKNDVELSQSESSVPPASATPVNITRERIFARAKLQATR